MPNGQDVMSIGDKVIVVTTNQGLDDISDIVKKNGKGENMNYGMIFLHTWHGERVRSTLSLCFRSWFR